MGVAKLCTFQKVNVHLKAWEDVRRLVKGFTRHGEDLYMWIFPVSSDRRNEIWDLKKQVVLIKPERNGRKIIMVRFMMLEG